MKKLLAVLGAGAVVAGCASMGGSPRIENGMLVSWGGMTVYSFDRDGVGTGKSVCDAQCAINWPPVMADPSDKPSGDWTFVSRDNGWQKQFDKNPTFATSMRSYFVVDNNTIRKQWAYKGKPLYLYIHDHASGDKTGDGVNGVWHVVRQ